MIAQKDMQIVRTAINSMPGRYIAPDATDAEVEQALIAAAQQDPEGMNAELIKAGYPATPWLTYLGLAAGAVAIYFVWSSYQTKKLGEIVRPEIDDDFRPRLRGFSKSLGRFAAGPSSRGLECMVPRRHKFEPEARLEGHRGIRRHKRSTR